MSAEVVVGENWSASGATRARGQAFGASGELLRARELAARFDALAGNHAWAAELARLNGSCATTASSRRRR